MAHKSTRTIKKFEWYDHPHRNLISCRESGILLILRSHSDLTIPTFEDQSWKKKYHAFGQEHHKVKSCNLIVILSSIPIPRRKMELGEDSSLRSVNISCRFIM